MTDRKLKKSETLEVRLPFETKTAFMARCRTDGRTASEAVRAYIDREIGAAEPVRRERSRWWQVAAAAAAGLTLGAVAAPSLAQVAMSHEAAQAFHALDADHDGVLTLAEFRGR